jgi:hypothetical protein
MSSTANIQIRKTFRRQQLREMVPLADSTISRNRRRRIVFLITASRSTDIAISLRC